MWRNEKLGKEITGGYILDCLKGKTPKGKPTTWIRWAVLLVMTILTIWFHGCTRSASAEELTASWYSVSSLHRDGQWNITHGRTASGQLFTDSGLTAASNDFPLGTKVRVSTSKASVVVLVNDRTAKRFTNKRIDLSPAAFSKISNLNGGIEKVTVEVFK